MKDILQNTTVAAKAGRKVEGLGELCGSLCLRVDHKWQEMKLDRGAEPGFLEHCLSAHHPDFILGQG
jgi:hypothetical protein